MLLGLTSSIGGVVYERRGAGAGDTRYLDKNSTCVLTEELVSKDGE